MLNLATSTFADGIAIVITVARVKAARLVFHYDMTNQKRETVCQAQSKTQ
ncbi:hypothetical protein ACVR0O_02060 [Streptococcus caviae]